MKQGAVDGRQPLPEGFPPRNAGASLKLRDHVAHSLGRQRFPPRNAGASLKQSHQLCVNVVVPDFPRAMRGPH